jgi:ribosomal protein S18 acetylase RimI-like enzyme
MQLRRAEAADALCLGALATQVFLDTYATEGIRRDLAREAINGYSPESFARLLSEANREFHLAEEDGALVGFVEIAFGRPCPVEVERPSSEVARLYVQQPFQRRGVGAALLRRAEALAAEAQCRTLWLTSWVGNSRALAFYRAMGYEDVGRTDHVIEGQAYENRVMAKPLAGSP